MLRLAQCAALLCMGHLASSGSSAQQSNSEQQQQQQKQQPSWKKLTLQALDDIFTTSMRRELAEHGAAHPEAAFEQALSFQEQRFEQQGQGERAPVLVCTARDARSISAVSAVVLTLRSQLVHSSGAQACLLVHATAQEAAAIAALAAVTSVDPLPHAAKLSTTVHAGFRTATATQPAAIPGSIRSDRAVPAALDVALAPGTWSIGLLSRWRTDLRQHGRRLWHNTLHQSTAWSTEHAAAAAAAAAAGDAASLQHDVTAPAAPLDAMWSAVAAAHASDECNFDALWSEGEEASASSTTATSSSSRKSPANSKKRAASAPVQAHDRVVIRGSNALGKDSVQGSHARCYLTLLAYLSTRSDVVYIDDLPQVKTQNTVAAWIVQSGVQESYPIWEAGLLGQTEIIAVADSGVDVASCFFTEDKAADNVECSTFGDPITVLTNRKVVQYIGYVDCEDSQGGHGTHVAGTLVGAQNDMRSGEHLGDGMGFASRLAVFDFGDSEGSLSTPSNLAVQMLDPAYTAGARISSNSWGAVRDSYTTLDRQMDAYAYEHRDFVMVVAAGNCGDPSSGCYNDANQPLSGAGSILSPALAKNVITVGASESTGASAAIGGDPSAVAYFSSQGPLASDGRIKPDVVAPGYHTYSAEAYPEAPGSCKVASMAGTSMAAPVVSGAAALIRQYFLQGWYPTGEANPSNVYNPSGALVKAVLVNSAIPMASYQGLTVQQTLGDGPDGYQGWGRVLMDAGLNIGGSVDMHAVDDVPIDTQGYSETYTYTVKTGYSGAFRATMVFLEPAAPAGVAVPVYNDVDLLVTAWDGNTAVDFYPNGGTGPDITNTVERVVIANAQTYEYFNVTVTGTAITTPDSPPYYALAVTGGQVNGYSPGLYDYGKVTWYASAVFTIGGTPTKEAITTNYRDAFAQALTDNMGDVLTGDEVQIVQVKGVTGSAGSAQVTVHLAAADKSTGNSIMSYLLAISDDYTTGGANSQFMDSLNTRLSGVRTNGCLCTATGDGTAGTTIDYNCSVCADDTPYTAVTSVTLGPGAFDLISTPAGTSGGAVIDTETHKISIAFVDSVIRTENLFYVAIVCALIVCVSALVGIAIYYKDASTRKSAAAAAKARKQGNAANRNRAAAAGGNRGRSRTNSPERSARPNRALLSKSPPRPGTQESSPVQQGTNPQRAQQQMTNSSHKGGSARPSAPPAVDVEAPR